MTRRINRTPPAAVRIIRFRYGGGNSPFRFGGSSQPFRFGGSSQPF